MNNNELYKNILLRAKELLLTDGWCKHIWRNEKGERCLLGAIRDAKAEFFGLRADFFTDECRAQSTAAWYDLVELLQKGTAEALGFWNDTRGSVKQVIGLIDKTVEDLNV